MQFLCALPLACGVDPSARNNFPLRAAAKHGHADVVRCLCSLPAERGVDPTAGTRSALRVAVEQRNAALVQYIRFMVHELRKRTADDAS